MSREDTRNEPHAVSIKPQSANLCRLITIVVLTTILAFAYVIIRRPADSLGDPSDQYMVKNIPSIYTKLECIDPEERDVFEGFRTSFLPAEEVNLARQQFIENSVEDDNVTSDTLIWGESEKPQEPATRVKRHFGFDTGSSSQSKEKEEASDYYDGDKENESEVQEDIDSSEANDPYNDENLHSVVHPELHVDRGPLDDVVEQVRGQPELEEGEMSSSASLFKKPSMSYTGIHAFWKGEGDRKTIRDTQAAIMKQYMDAEADPCQDFYQYACGNWANLNPIPADKAGYDTFEMLRENLDSVLKELLEFKPCEMIYSQYPGPHLDTQNIYLLNEHHDMVKISNSSDAFVKNVSHAANFAYDTQISRYHIEIKNRIRRYLNNTRKKAPVPKKLKFRKDKYEYRINRVKRQILNRKHKPNKKLLSRMKSLRNIKSNKEFRLARKLMMAKTKKQKSRKTRETKSSKKDKCKPVCEKKEDGQSCYELMDPANGDAALKARFLFRSCMNYEILDKRGHQPLLDLLDLLGGWPILNSSWSNRNFDWLGLMANLRLYNNDILISEWVGPDIKNSDEFVIQFDQTSLGLPTRDYFLQQSNKVYLNAYKDYLIKIALLLGGSNRHVKKSANDLIDFETKLAKITSAPEDRRNVSELYRRMPLHKLEALVPDIEWRRYLCIVMNRTVGSNETVVLFALPYVRHLVDLIDETPNPTLANYLMWRFVRHRVNNLDDRFQSAKQQFYFVLFGREQAPPRWKNCISQVNSNMGMALGSMFVRKYFDETSKNDTLTMTREIQTSFRELLNLIGWIDDQTKSLAARKVDAMMLRIGYPDFILVQRELDERYKEVIIHPDKYFENILNILQHLTKMEQSRIGQPVNKTLWNTAPAVVNAYYSRNKNQIMFPAGILQPPFYHRHFPRSLNYGGIGVVIGHEITHGFDDKGRLFDCDGNLHRWWSDSAIESFHRRAQCLIDQYGLYLVPEVHMKLDGMNTQGENIADNGGVKQAFRAYLNWTQKHGVSGETLPGLNHTHTQLFFLNFAQVWCGAMRPEAMRNKLKTAVHSPGRFRVIGTLSNSHDFAREFKCPPGSPMNPVHKCTVW